MRILSAFTLIFLLHTSYANERISVPLRQNLPWQGIYLSHYALDTARGDLAVKTLGQNWGNTVILDAKDLNGRLFFPSDKTDPFYHKLHDQINQFHKQGVKVVVRLVCFADKKTASEQKHLRLKDKRTGLAIRVDNMDWVDPSHPQIQANLLSYMQLLVENYGVDGIQLDYVRFPNYKPSLATHNTNDSRSSIIEDFVSKVHALTRASDIELGLAIFGITLWERNSWVIGQDLIKLAEYCDVLSPMIYPSHFGAGFAGIDNPADNPDLILEKSIQRYYQLTKNMKNPPRFCPYLQAFRMNVSLYDKNYFVKTASALPSDNQSYLFWNARGSYTYLFQAVNAFPKQNIYLVNAD